MERKQIIDALLKSGSEKVNGLKIKNVTVTELDSYVRVAFTTDKKTKRYVDDGTGTYVLGESNVVMTSLFAVVATIRDNDTLSFAANHILEHPHALEVMLSRGTIDIVLEPVTAGQEYKNPWSDNATPTVFDHDTIICHVVNITPGPMAGAATEAIAKNLLGI